MFRSETTEEQDVGGGNFKIQLSKIRYERMDCIELT
jgi:hypothetical protein